MNQIRDSLFIDFERGDGNSNIAIHRSRDIALVGDSLGSLYAFSFLEREWKEFRIGEVRYSLALTEETFIDCSFLLYFYW